MTKRQALEELKKIVDRNKEPSCLRFNYSMFFSRHFYRLNRCYIDEVVSEMRAYIHSQIQDVHKRQRNKLLKGMEEAAQDAMLTKPEIVIEQDGSIIFDYDMLGFEIITCRGIVERYKSELLLKVKPRKTATLSGKTKTNIKVITKSAVKESAKALSLQDIIDKLKLIYISDRQEIIDDEVIKEFAEQCNSKKHALFYDLVYENIILVVDPESQTEVY